MGNTANLNRIAAGKEYYRALSPCWRMARKSRLFKDYKSRLFALSLGEKHEIFVNT